MCIIYLFRPCWVFDAAHGLSLAAVSRGYSSFGAWASHCSGFSCCRPLVLSTCAYLLCGMWDLPRPGIEPVSPALACGLFTTGPPEREVPSLSFIPYMICQQNPTDALQNSSRIWPLLITPTAIILGWALSFLTRVIPVTQKLLSCSCPWSMSIHSIQRDPGCIGQGSLEKQYICIYDEDMELIHAVMKAWSACFKLRPRKVG